jgi:two-component system phosphate regulon response regulator PhoB
VSEPAEGRRDAPELTLVPAQSAVLAGGREVALTSTQFRLLAVLLSEPGRAFTRAELVERGIVDLVEERTVDVHVKDLRRRLGEWGHRVVAVRGVGYRYRVRAGQDIG